MRFNNRCNQKQYSLDDDEDVKLLNMENLIADIEQDTINTSSTTGVKKIDSSIITAIKNTDRRHFVLEHDQQLAYADFPLNIGCGQTISQPFIVALMVHLIRPKANDVVLEIGSGSGYTVAVLSKLCRRVIGIEIIEELANRSRSILQKQAISNATILCQNGIFVTKEYAPFDKIIVSAATKTIPEVWLEHLAIGGFMVLPKSLNDYDQMLIRIQKISAHECYIENILPVRFVPLVSHV